MTRKAPADYSDAVQYSADVFAALKIPIRSGDSWRQSDDLLFTAGLWAAPREHSERNKLNRMAASFKVSKVDRNYLGRWKADGSDNYITTSRQMTLDIQDHVYGRLRSDLSAYDESEMFDMFMKFLTLKGADEEVARFAVSHCFP